MFVVPVDNNMGVPRDESLSDTQRADESGQNELEVTCASVTAEVLHADEFGTRSCCSVVPRSSITEKIIYRSCSFLKHKSFEIANSAYLRFYE